MPNHTHDALWHREIAERIERNGALEVSVVHAPGHGDIVKHEPYRVRPFALDEKEDTLVVERFRGGEDAAVPCPEGSRLDVFLVSDVMRYSAAYEVEKIGPYQINPERKLVSMWLKRTGEVTSAQRRSSFRVDTSNAGFGKVAINLPGPTGQELKPLFGILVNLSADGMGLLVEGDTKVITENQDDSFDLHLTLPGTKDAMVIPSKIRRLEPRRGRGVYLGLQFNLKTSSAVHRRTRETIAQLTTELQRNQIRNRRRA